MKLIGYAFETGRVDFSREDNPWAFSRIMVNPTQAPVELKSAAINEATPTWMKEVERLMLTADKIVLQYKEPGILRFRRATHSAKPTVATSSTLM